MQYRFLLTNREGVSGSFEGRLENNSQALRMAASIISDVTFIYSVHVYQLLTDDSCGPIRFIGSCNHEDL